MIRRLSSVLKQACRARASSASGSKARPAQPSEEVLFTDNRTGVFRGLGVLCVVQLVSSTLLAESLYTLDQRRKQKLVAASRSVSDSCSTAFDDGDDETPHTTTHTAIDMDNADSDDNGKATALAKRNNNLSAFGRASDMLSRFTVFGSNLSAAMPVLLAVGFIFATRYCLSLIGLLELESSRFAL
jgi:hypothetical protein